jgi:hypothetical protein
MPANRLALAALVAGLLSSAPVLAWRGGGFSAGGFHAGGFGGGVGGFHAEGFHAGGFGGDLGGFSSFHAGGFGDGCGSVHYAGASHYGPVTGFSHVGGGSASGAAGSASWGGATHAGYGGAEHYGSASYAGYGGYAHYSGASAYGGGAAWTSHSVNYGSIQHYDDSARITAASGLNVYHGPAGGTAATWQGAYASGAAVRGPAGYGAAAVKGPAGGTAAAYRGPYSSGAVAQLPSGYTATAYRGSTYYVSGYSFYHPTFYAGAVSYVPVAPPIGFFFAALPPAATTTVVNNTTYYVSNGVYYQPSSQDGQPGYAVVSAPAQAPAQPVQPAPQAAPPAQAPQPAGLAGGGPDPFALLKKMSDYMGGQKQIRMTVNETFDEVTGAGQKIQLFNDRKIEMKRPDRILVEVNGAGLRRRITCDGDTFTLVDFGRNLYASMPMQGSLDLVMDALARDYGMAQPVEDLLYADLNARLAPRIQSGQFLGQEKVSGRTCNHVAFKQAGLSWQAWIEDGDKPVPWRVVVSYDTAPGRPQYTLLVAKFETPLLMPDLQFRAKVPDGAMSASLLTLSGKSGQGQ